MAKRWTTTSTFAATADALVAVLTDPDFVIEQHELDEAVASATIREVERTPARLIQEVESVEYARSMTGLDKTKRQTAWVTFDWDLDARRCSWSYKSAHGSRVKVSGTDRVTPRGEGSLLESEWRVEVKIPLIGGQIEKLVIKEAEAARSVYEALIRTYLDTPG